jgi:hypothetical protein
MNRSAYLNDAYLLNQKAPKGRMTRVCGVWLVRG